MEVVSPRLCSCDHAWGLVTSKASEAVPPGGGAPARSLSPLRSPACWWRASGRLYFLRTAPLGKSKALAGFVARALDQTSLELGFTWGKLLALLPYGN